MNKDPKTMPLHVLYSSLEIEHRREFLRRVKLMLSQGCPESEIEKFIRLDNKGWLDYLFYVL